MTERMYIHVGPHKTGTTYIQGLLGVNHDRMVEQGVLSPLPTLGSVKDAMRRGKTLRKGGNWGKLRTRLEKWDGPAAVVSHEMISSASEAELGRLVKGLRPFELHVIYTARDLSRVAPAMWQTGLRSTRSFTWHEYAGSLQQPETSDLPWGKRFWNSQDAVAVLQRWRKHLPVQNLHVVTVPRPGAPPELLWQRFCAVLGVDPAGHDLKPPRSNPSLGTAEAELMRRVNEALDGGRLKPKVRMARMRWIGRELETRADMARFTLPPDDFGWLTDRAERVIAGLRAGGYDIVGDLDDLVPHPVDPDRARHPTDTSTEAVLDVAVDTIRRMVLELARPPRPPRK